MTFTTKRIATPEAREAARKVTIAIADARAAALAPVISEIRASGTTEPYAIAAALMRRGILTARGHRFWGATQVRKILNRLDRLAANGVAAAPAPATRQCRPLPFPRRRNAALVKLAGDALQRRDTCRRIPLMVGAKSAACRECPLRQKALRSRRPTSLAPSAGHIRIGGARQRPSYALLWVTRRAN
jgi:hypothetical protein